MLAWQLVTMKAYRIYSLIACFNKNWSIFYTIVYLITSSNDDLYTLPIQYSIESGKPFNARYN